MQQLLGDKQSYYRLFEICDKIKEERAKEAELINGRYTGLKARDVLRQLGYSISEEGFIVEQYNQTFITGV